MFRLSAGPLSASLNHSTEQAYVRAARSAWWSFPLPGHQASSHVSFIRSSQPSSPYSPSVSSRTVTQVSSPPATPLSSLYFCHQLQKYLGRQVSISPRKSGVRRKEEGGDVGRTQRERRTDGDQPELHAEGGSGV